MSSAAVRAQNELSVLVPSMHRACTCLHAQPPQSRHARPPACSSPSPMSAAVLEVPPLQNWPSNAALEEARPTERRRWKCRTRPRRKNFFCERRSSPKPAGRSAGQAFGRGDLVAAAGDEGVDDVLVDDVDLDAVGIETGGLEQWRGVEPDGIFDLGVADQRQLSTLGPRRSGPRAAQTHHAAQRDQEPHAERLQAYRCDLAHGAPLCALCCPDRNGHGL